MLGYSTIFGDWTNQGFLRVPDRSTTVIHPTHFFSFSPVAARRGIGVWWPHVCMEKTILSLSSFHMYPPKSSFTNSTATEAKYLLTK